MVVLGVALSADARLVASSSFDRTVRVWDVATGRLLTTLHGHTGGVWGVALSGDGRLVASGSADRTVRLWDAATGQNLRTLRGHPAAVWGVALSVDGSIVASGGADGTVRVWQVNSDGEPFVLRADRRYERMNITGLTGVTPAQREALLALGAIDHATASTSPSTAARTLTSSGGRL
jgi:WD40 repeat protein